MRTARNRDEGVRCGYARIQKAEERWAQGVDPLPAVWLRGHWQIAKRHLCVRCWRTVPRDGRSDRPKPAQLRKTSADRRLDTQTAAGFQARQNPRSAETGLRARLRSRSHTYAVRLAESRPRPRWKKTIRQARSFFR